MKVESAGNIDALRTLARARLPKIIADYLDGGAEDERTLACNRAAFDDIAFVPRVAAGHRQADLGVSLFGADLARPFVVGPTGLNGIFHRDADRALARAAHRAGAAFVLGTASNLSIETIGAEPGVKWFQLYPWGDTTVWHRLLERARAAGMTTLFVTVDTPVPGNRERDRRNRFAHDVTITPRTILDGLTHPRWLFDVWLHGVPRFENLVEFLHPAATVHEIADFTKKHRHPDLDWADLGALRRRWDGPFVVKGVMSPRDVAHAIAIGADGIVVSNHGGRQLDGAVATMRALPPIVDIAAGRIDVLVDGGIRRGSDVVKALALGAKAVVLGRAPLYGVAAGGEAGATRALTILHEETARVMTLLGCGSVADLSPAFLATNHRGAAADAAAPPNLKESP